MTKNLFFIICLLPVSFSLAAQKQNLGKNNHAQPPGLLISIPSQELHNDLQLPANGSYAVPAFVSATVKNNKLSGEWKSWHSNAMLLDSGSLKAGVPDGTWKIWDSSGHLRAIRNYDAAKLQRVKEELKLNHPRNYFFGITEISKKNKQLAKAYLSSAYSFAEANPLPKGMNLDELVFSNRQQEYHPVFAESLHDGLYMNFFSNAVTKDSGMHKDGMPEGVWLHRNYADGYYWTGAYRKGVRQYEWKQFAPDGKLLLLIFYNKEGEETGRKKIKE